jgi:HK97 family phage portal protein
MPSPSLNAQNKPSWFPRLMRGIASRIDPEIYEQEQGGIVMTQYGIVKRVKNKAGVSQFGEINGSNQFVIERPGAGIPVDPSRALENFKGFVYAAVNAKAREVMTIDWRLFSADGEDTKEESDHELLNLLDSPNDNMNGLELKYLTSACLDLTGNTYWWLEGVNSDTDQPKGIHLMPPDRVRPVIDRRSWPYQLIGYKMKLETVEMAFKPYEIVHFRGPNPSNFFEGYSPVMAGAAYIDNDNDATRFNSNFFRNGARPAGFLESDFVAESQLEALKVGFADMHGGIDNMNRIGVLPKGVKWSANGATPKDMDFGKMSLEMKDRILSMFGASKTILGTAESDTNRACYDDQTEVLTQGGWKKYYEVMDGEAIAEYDGVTNEVRFALPLGKYVYPYKGKMLHFENCKMDIMVTPDHRMWYRPDHKGANYRIGFAEDLPKMCYFKAAAPQNGGESPQIFSIPYYQKGSHPENKSRNFMMNDWLEFLGYVISEGGVSSGSNRIITLYQKKQPHTKKILACLKRLKKSGCLNFGSYPDKEEGGTRFNVYGAPLIFWMHDNIGSYANDKHLPAWVFGLDMRQRRILFDALMVGDGSIDPRENRQCGYYSTTSHQLADDVQRLAFSLGIQSHADIHYEANGNRNTCYRVMFDFGSTEQQLDWQHRDMRTEVDYDGNVWCFKTTTGLFVTRRNGKIALQGNTAETADYVFSKRVIKPHMIAICGTLNDRLTGRYGDNLYVSFIDPVPEDKAARNTEMMTSVGGQPILTVNEAREQFMGAGPVDGGDVLMSPTAMAPVGQAQKPSDTQAQPEDDPNSKTVHKTITANRTKAANGLRVGYRPSRTKFQRIAKNRSTQAKSLADKITADLKEKLNAPSKKFESTKEQDELAAKDLAEFTHAAEKDVVETMKALNAEQRKEVLANLEAAITKGINPSDLFNLDNWISITTNAILPIMETLSAHQAAEALAAIGEVSDKPYSDALKASVHESVQMMSESYNKTTLEALESHINDGLQAGESLADITKRVEQVYQWSDDSRAGMVAKTESFRATNGALKQAWKESGVVKTVRWFTSGLDSVCPYCLKMDGTTIPIDDVFFKNGESITAGEGDAAKTMSLDYGDVGSPPLHVQCRCFLRPADISI